MFLKDFTEEKLRLFMDDVIDRNEGIITLKSDVSVLKADVIELKTDVKALKADVEVLKADVKVLKSDVGSIKSDISILKKSVHEQGLNIESMKDDIRLIAESISPFLKRFEDVDRMRSIIDRHNGDIKDTQRALGAHIANKKVHLSKNQ